MSPENWEAKPWKEQREMWVKLYCRGTTEWGAVEGWYAKLGQGRKVFADSSPDERLAKVKEWYLRGVTWKRTDEQKPRTRMRMPAKSF